MESRPTEADSIVSRIDELPLRPMHIFAVLACALGLFFDLAEFAIGNALSAVFSAPPYSADVTALSWLLAAVYLGAIAGAFATGWLADRYGRRSLIIVLLAIISLSSVAAAASPDILSLATARGLSGLALGAYPPLMASYLTDILPARNRGGLIMATVALGATGPLALIFLIRWLTPIEPLGVEGWRWAFIVCAAAAGICMLWFRKVPESPRWLVSQGRLVEAKTALARFGSAADSLEHHTKPSSPETRSTPAPREKLLSGRLGFLLFIYFLAPWSTIGFPLLSGAVLIHKGVNLGDSLFYVGISSIGPVAGAIVAGFAIDRIERRTALIVSAIAMATLGFTFGVSQSPAWLMASGLAYNMVIAIFMPTLVIYAAELFPTAQRARATSWSWAIRGIGATLTPLILLPLLQSSGTVAMFCAIAASLFVFVAALTIWGPPGVAGQAIR
ncbi:MFS transporter [Taklimakanibacter lacteus]|uniref:MFS transporter n=1 Tax=Taklimakanibacter lacteus TaxID=2268456 RepID=UPI000E65F3B7